MFLARTNANTGTSNANPRTSDGHSRTTNPDSSTTNSNASAADGDASATNRDARSSDSYAGTNNRSRGHNDPDGADELSPTGLSPQDTACVEENADPETAEKVFVAIDALTTGEDAMPDHILDLLDAAEPLSQCGVMPEALRANRCAQISRDEDGLRVSLSKAVSNNSWHSSRSLKNNKPRH